MKKKKLTEKEKRRKPKFIIPANTYAFQNRNLSDLPGEIWKEFPGYEVYYVISNYGRIKQTGRWKCFGRNTTEGYQKEKILFVKVLVQNSPSNKDVCYYLYTCFRVNKQTKYIRLARYVYCLFVKPFDISKHRAFLIQYRDNNGLNIHCSNLVLSNPQKRQNKTIKRKRNPRLIPVTQFSITGEKLNVFGTLGIAARSIKGHASGIYNVLYKPPHYYLGYLWAEGTAEEIKPLPEALINHPKTVVQCDPEGRPLKIYPSLCEAAKAVNAYTVNLRKALNGKVNTCRGFTWKWFDEKDRYRQAVHREQ